jgi:hypothetical protein
MRKLLELFKNYRRGRRYNAALAILVAAYTYERLGSLDKHRVDEAVSRINPAREGYEETYRTSDDDYAAMSFAFVMRDLGISPAISNQTWTSMLGNRATSLASIHLYWSIYTYFDYETSRARQYLRSIAHDFDQVIDRYASHFGGTGRRI